MHIFILEKSEPNADISHLRRDLRSSCAAEVKESMQKRLKIKF